MSDKLSIAKLQVDTGFRKDHPLGWGEPIYEQATPADLISVLSSDPRLLVEVLEGLGAFKWPATIQRGELAVDVFQPGIYLVYGPIEEEK